MRKKVVNTKKGSFLRISLSIKTKQKKKRALDFPPISALWPLRKINYPAPQVSTFHRVATVKRKDANSRFAREKKNDEKCTWVTSGADGIMKLSDDK